MNYPRLWKVLVVLVFLSFQPTFLSSGKLERFESYVTQDALLFINVI